MYLFIRLKKTQLALLKKALENKKRIMAHMREKMLIGDQKAQEPKNLQTAIYRFVTLKSVYSVSQPGYPAQI